MIEIGKTYLVKAQRKGTFMLRVINTNDEWVTGIIAGGMADAMLDYNRRGTGEEITVRRSMATFTEQP